MKFILRVSMNNEAFAGGNEGVELARILRKVADSIENTGKAPRSFENVRDINGNTVGHYAAKPGVIYA